MIIKGYREQDAVRGVCSAILYENKFSQLRVQEGIDELRRREDADAIEVNFSAIAASLAYEVPFMHTANHPNRLAMTMLGNDALRRLGLGQRIAETGADYLSDVIMPPLPSTAWNLKLRPGIHGWDHVVCGRRLDQENYLRRNASYYKCYEPKLLAALLYGRSEAVGFLREHQESVEGVRHRELAWHLLSALYSVLLERTPSDTEVEGKLRDLIEAGASAVVGSFPASAEFRDKWDSFVARFAPARRPVTPD